MDYEFLRDVTGVVKVRMSMGHEVIGHWFNEEVKENLALLDEVEDAARTLKGSERSWQRAGHEYTLWMDGEEVMVRANQLEFAGDEMEEGMNYYDEESLSLCGVEDFLQVVAAYRDLCSRSRLIRRSLCAPPESLNSWHIAPVINLAHLFPQRRGNFLTLAVG